MSKVSVPSSLRVSQFCPGRNCRGTIPIPTRFDLWILSNDSAMTALTPSRSGPLAAQSLLLPVPYSLPARMIRGVMSSSYFLEVSKIVSTEPSGIYLEQLPSEPGTSMFLSLTLANVPLTMTSWLALRDP